MMKYQSVYLIFIFQILWRSCLGDSPERSQIIAKNDDPQFKIMTATAKTKLEPIPSENIQLNEKETSFPETQFPSSILDIKSYFLNPKLYEDVDSDAQEDHSKKLKRPCFENYKRKQRIRAMNKSFKIVHESFDHEPEKINVENNPQRGMTSYDKLLINKILKRKPWQCQKPVIQDDFEPKVYNMPNKKALRNQFQSSFDSFIKSHSEEMTVPMIVDNLISITEQIFDSLLSYVNENAGLNILTEEETTEILQVVDNLKEVLEILDFLSSSEAFTSCDVTQTNKENAVNSTNDHSSSEESQEVSNEIMNKTIEAIPVAGAIDNALTKIEGILNNTMTCSNNHTGEIARTTTDMIESIKRILEVMEGLDKNVQTILEADPVQLFKESNSTNSLEKVDSVKENLIKANVSTLDTKIDSFITKK